MQCFYSRVKVKDSKLIKGIDTIKQYEQNDIANKLEFGFGREKINTLDGLISSVKVISYLLPNYSLGFSQTPQY
jgi:hypothetical protein